MLRCDPKNKDKDRQSRLMVHRTINISIQKESPVFGVKHAKADATAVTFYGQNVSRAFALATERRNRHKNSAVTRVEARAANSQEREGDGDSDRGHKDKDRNRDSNITRLNKKAALLKGKLSYGISK